MKLKGLILLAIFSSTLVALLRYVGFDAIDQRSSSGRMFLYVLIALLGTGAADWVLNTIGV